MSKDKYEKPEEIEKKDLKRKYPIRFYLEKTDHKPAIKEMMKDLFKKSKSKSLEDWEALDKQINNRRC